MVECVGTFRTSFENFAHFLVFRSSLTLSLPLSTGTPSSYLLFDNGQVFTFKSQAALSFQETRRGCLRCSRRCKTATSIVQACENPGHRQEGFDTGGRGRWGKGRWECGRFVLVSCIRFAGSFVDDDGFNGVRQVYHRRANVLSYLQIFSFFICSCIPCISCMLICMSSEDILQDKPTLGSLLLYNINKSILCLIPCTTDVMEIEGQITAEPKKVSTHGRTPSRREEWRLAKGKPVKPKYVGSNRQGVPAARRKPGRSQRRRWRDSVLCPLSLYLYTFCSFLSPRLSFTILFLLVDISDKNLWHYHSI